jgi:hypothetical protein
MSSSIIVVCSVLAIKLKFMRFKVEENDNYASLALPLTVPTSPITLLSQLSGNLSGKSSTA